jgi:DNA-directed RNA polymerase I, II, and III subunit RPABC2
MADEDDYEDMADVAEELEEVEGDEEDENGGEREIAKEGRALQFLNLHHPECLQDYREEVIKKLPLNAFPADSGSDRRHKSVPYLTLFEKTKILGFRANQLAQGGIPFVNIPAHITDVLEIAALELEQKRLPYILKRPMPDGSFEYIRLTDLLVV